VLDGDLLGQDVGPSRNRQVRALQLFGEEGRVLVDLRRTTPSRNCLCKFTRRRSDGRVDGVTVASRRVDAIDAKFKLRNWRKRTLSRTYFTTTPVSTGTPMRRAPRRVSATPRYVASYSTDALPGKSSPAKKW